MSPPAEPGQPLTAEERARVRPGIDLAKVERFVGAVPATQRALAILPFLREITNEDLAAIGADAMGPDKLASMNEALNNPRASMGVHFADPKLEHLRLRRGPGRTRFLG